MVKALTDEQVLNKALENSGFNETIDKLKSKLLDALGVAYKNSKVKMFGKDKEVAENEISEGLFNLKLHLIKNANNPEEIEKYLKAAEKLSNLNPAKTKYAGTVSAEDYYTAQGILTDLGFSEEQAKGVVDIAYYSEINIFEPLKGFNADKVIEEIKAEKLKNEELKRKLQEEKSQEAQAKNNSKNKTTTSNPSVNEANPNQSSTKPSSKIDENVDEPEADIEALMRKQWNKEFEEEKARSKNRTKDIEPPNRGNPILQAIMDFLQPILQLFGMAKSAGEGVQKPIEQNQQKPKAEEPAKESGEQKPKQQKPEQETKATNSGQPQANAEEKVDNQTNTQAEEGKNETANVDTSNSTNQRQPTQEDIAEAKSAINGQENSEDVVSLMSNLNSNFYQGDFSVNRNKQQVLG